MSDRLTMMISLLLRQLEFEDQFGRRFVLTGFKEDGRVALLSRQDSESGMPMEVETLDGLTLIGEHSRNT